VKPDRYILIFLEFEQNLTFFKGLSETANK